MGNKDNKYYIIILTFLLSCTVLSTPAAQTDSPTKRQKTVHIYTEKRPLIYEDYWNLWPYSFLDEYGKPTGFNVELTEMILKQLKIPYIIKLKDIKDVLKDIHEGKANLMISVCRHDRDSVGTWGMENLSIYTQSILQAKNEPNNIHTLTDIKHHPVIMRPSSLVYRLAMRKGLKNYIISTGDMRFSILDNAQRNRGTFIWNTMSLKWLKRKYKLDNMVLIPLNMKSRECRFFGNDPNLIAQMDSVYTTLSPETQMRLTNKWFYPEVEDSGIPSYVGYIMWGLILLTLILGIMNRYYHVKNEKATGRFRRMNQLLDIVVGTANIQVLIYSIDEGRFYILDERGREVDSLLSIDYLESYSFESGNSIRRAVYNIRDGKTDDTRLTIYGHPDEEGKRRSYEMHIARMPENSTFKNPLVFTIQDVTEQRSKDQDIHHVLLQYHAAFNSSMVDYIMFDHTGRMQDINQHFFQTFGITDSVKFRNLHASIHSLPNLDFYDTNAREDVRYTAKIYMDHLADDEQFQGTITRRGIMYWDILIRPVLSRTGEIIGTSVSGRDITEIVCSYHRQQIVIQNENQANEESQRYLESINLSLQATNLSLIEYDPHSHSFHLQQNIWTRKIFIPQIRAIFMTQPEDLEKAIEAMKAMDVKYIKDFHLRLHICILKGHPQRWMQFDLTPVLNADGTVRIYAGTCRDITEIAEVEKQLMLETRKAQEMETLKNSFISNMSYEIRTPLSAVVGFSELLGKSHTPAEDTIFIQQIKENTNILLNLVNDILLLSRIDANMIEYKSAPIDFVPIIMENFKMVVDNYRKPNVQYILENSYRKLVVDIDSSHLSIVFRYIFTNATRYTNQGHCRCRYEYRHNELTIYVEDSGAGMNKDHQKHAFDRFAHNVETGVIDSGLTLPICKEMISRMGGHIELESYQNRGTFIWVSIPCKAIEIERAAESNTNINEEDTNK